MKLRALIGLVVIAGCARPTLPDLPANIVGSCKYVNSFSKLPECRDYHGTWTETEVRSDCAGWAGTAQIGATCDVKEVMGYCLLKPKAGQVTRISLPGNDASKCQSTVRGCELFGGGAFDPAPICGGVTTGENMGLPVFQAPELSCRDPKPGEPAGRSAGGKVCTWEVISGATEEGRHYDDYASCDRVRTQRPYYPAPPPRAGYADADPRMSDSTYSQEHAWVKRQIESTACVCCHSTRAPKGSSNWVVDQPTGNFINGFADRGLAMGAGWIDTVGFGAYPKEENNGFSRATPDRPTDSIFVTTDPERMKRFFEAELARRGKTRADFNERYGAGPLDDQRFFVPQACQNGEGVGADGTITWSGTGARYVYVLEAGSTSPGAPPNLDLPPGTVWRLDVPYTGMPMPQGSVRYGVVPEGVRQAFPKTGQPAALVSGRQYALYALSDIAFPMTRCVFTAP